MSRIVRGLFALAAIVFIAGVGTCYFGVDHEIAKIPPHIRASMTDTDWVGTEWVALGMAISGGGIAILVIAFAFRARVRSRTQRQSPQGDVG